MKPMRGRLYAAEELTTEKAAPAWSVRLPALPMPELSLNRYLGYGGHWKRQEWRDVQRDAWLTLLSIASPAIREAANAYDDPMNSLPKGSALFRSGWYPSRVFRYPVSIVVRLTGTGRRWDVQNWVSHYGLKVLVDCLTAPSGRKEFGLGVLPDDSMRYVSAFAVSVEPDGEPGTEITIAEMPQDTH